MTGSDKIINQILDEAKAQAAQIVAQAEEKAAQIARQTQQTAESDAQAQFRKTQREADALLSGADSAAALIVRNALLQEKRAQIDKTLRAALDSLRAMPAPAYFDMLLVLIQKAKRQGEGVVYLDKTDLSRAPAAFRASLQELSLSLSETPRKTGGGCIVQYGEIEQNCTFPALAEEKRDALEDAIYHILFPQSDLRN